MDLVERTTAIVMEQLGNDALPRVLLRHIGRRNYTFTAWTDPEAAQAALAVATHTRQR